MTCPTMTHNSHIHFHDDWTTVFVDPQNSDWEILRSLNGKYIMNHMCKPNPPRYPAPGSQMYVGKCCINCGNEWTTEFHGFFKLAKFGAETT